MAALGRTIKGRLYLDGKVRGFETFEQYFTDFWCKVYFLISSNRYLTRNFFFAFYWFQRPHCLAYSSWVMNDLFTRDTYIEKQNLLKEIKNIFRLSFVCSFLELEAPHFENPRSIKISWLTENIICLIEVFPNCFSIILFKSGNYSKKSIWKFAISEVWIEKAKPIHSFFNLTDLKWNRYKEYAFSSIWRNAACLVNP